jgi:hypothetical protein
VIVCTLSNNQKITFGIPLVDVPKVIAYMLNEALRASERSSIDEIIPESKPHEHLPIKLTSVALRDGGDGKNQFLHLRSGHLEQVFNLPNETLFALAQKVIRTAGGG